MPPNASVAAVVLGGVLVLIALLGGKFKLFGAEVGESTGRLPRLVAGVMGVLILAIGLGPILPDKRDDRPSVARLTIERVEQVERHPLWGNEFLDDDEIVATVKGTSSLANADLEDFQLVTFWRLSNAYETNWHAGRRRVGGNYRLATLEGRSARAGPWEFLVGGIEAEKGFAGAVAVVVAAVPREYIATHAEAWLGDKNGWGFESLPLDERSVVSAPATFTAKPTR